MSRFMESAPSTRRPIHYFQRPSLRYGRGFLEELTPEFAVLLLCHPLEPGTSLFLEMRALDRRLTRMPLGTVTRSERQGPGRWLVRCRFVLHLNAGEVHLGRCA
jgi:hypothetical protein